MSYNLDDLPAYSSACSTKWYAVKIVQIGPTNVKYQSSGLKMSYDTGGLCWCGEISTTMAYAVTRIHVYVSPGAGSDLGYGKYKAHVSGDHLCNP